MTGSPDRRDVASAARIMAQLGLVTAYGHVSKRNAATMLITPAADLRTVGEADLVEVELSATTLPTGAPAESWAHLAVYRARADAGAVARAQPPSTFAVAATADRLAPIYGQAAWLGESVPVHGSAHLLRTPERAAAAAADFGDGDALLLRGNGALTLGTDPGSAVTRMWLLDALCTAWLAVRGRGDVAALTDEEIASWRAVGGQLLPRLWQHLCTDTTSPLPERGTR